MRPPVSAEWLWYCVRLWSTSVDQSDSARGVSTPAIAGQASSAQAILRGQVLGTISEGCNTPRVPAHCCIPLRSLYSDISQCDFRRGLGLVCVSAIPLCTPPLSSSKRTCSPLPRQSQVALPPGRSCEDTSRVQSWPGLAPLH